MSVIRIERVPVSLGGLGFFGFDHLQLVLQPDDLNPNSQQDNWYVIEGVRDAGSDGPLLGVEGSNGTTTLSTANGGLSGSDLTSAIGTAAQRGSHVLPTFDAFNTWQLIASYAREIDLQQLPYISYGLPGTATPTVNSTSVIASLLYYAGIDISTSWPSGTRFSPGWTTLLGTRANDHMVMDASFTTLMAGQGNDTLEGSNDDRIDKMYGGLGNDLFKWSQGFNYIHGGQARLAYTEDGTDTMDYSGAGVVTISANQDYVPHETPNYIATFAGGADYLYSIERLQWNNASDTILLDGGARLFQDGLVIGLGSQSSAGHGDTVDFSSLGEDLLIQSTATTGELIARDAAHLDSDKGVWLDSAEWLVGSAGDDSIYSASGLLGIEGGAGNDLIDAHALSAFTGQGANGADVELAGGEGNDTIVSNGGITLAHGGAGADKFILSSMTSGTQTTEFIIDDADAYDQLYVPYALFDGSGGSLDGSTLMPLLGGIGSWSNLVNNGWASFFDFRTQSDTWYGTDLSQGIIKFLGDIEYTLDGNDLVIDLFQGHTALSTDYYTGRTFYQLMIDWNTDTRIRIKDFQLGDLGLQFIDEGTPTTVTLNNGRTVLSYPNWDAAVHYLTNDGHFDDPLAAPPAPPATRPDEEAAAVASMETTLGSDSADIIALTQQGRVDGAAGDDSITGSVAADTLIGGAGVDTLVGGAGNDTYYVESTSDIVVESVSQGRDRVIASADYNLSENVESLLLTGSAIHGSGNDLANELIGSDLANVLDGQAGDDTLAGMGGDDVLQGGSGADSYVYALGDGHDVIVDYSTNGEANRLVLSGIQQSEIIYYRLQSAPGDLIIGMPDGGSITLRDFVADPGAGVRQITLENGVVTASDLAALAATAPLLLAPPPTAVDDLDGLIDRSVSVVNANALLANDVGYSGQALHVVSVASLGGGEVSLRADGNLDVIAASGSDNVSFRYTVSDGIGGTASAKAIISFSDNRAPIVSGTIGQQTASELTPFTLKLPDGLFSDPDADPLTLSAGLADGNPLPPWLAFDAATASFSGTPPAGSSGQFDIRITATDGVASASTSFMLAMQQDNHAPTAVADALRSEEGLPFIIPAAALTANDLDLDNDRLSIAEVSAATHGTVILQPDGSVLFAPEPGFVGVAGFNYVVSDGRGGMSTAAVSMELTASAGRSIVGTIDNDQLYGTTGADTFAGGTGDDTLTGFAGNDVFLVDGQSTGLDVFIGGDGADRIEGGTGDDIIGLQNVPGALSSIESINGGAGYDILRGTTGNDTIDLTGISLINVELIDGGIGDDLITGSAAADTIHGGAGNDTVRGGARGDVLAGDAGDDLVIGGGGNDTIVGGTGNDTMRGGAGNDVLQVQGADNGVDMLVGGAGFDKLLGSTANDTIMLVKSIDNLAGIEAIDMGAGIDQIIGSSGNDFYDLSSIVITGLELFDGGAGNDTIVASLGDDTLKGGAGRDTFVIGTGSGHHTVTDFNIGSAANPHVDVIDLSAFGFGSFAAVLSHAAAAGATNTLISLDATTSLMLLGVNMNTLKSDDFRL